MNFLRKSLLLLIIVILIEGCLSTSFANTIQADYSPCLLKKCLCSYGRKIKSTQLFLNPKVYPQGIHSDCISFQASNTEETIPIWIDLEDEDISPLVSDISGEKDSSPIDLNINFQVYSVISKLPPLFLLVSSFQL